MEFSSVLHPLTRCVHVLLFAVFFIFPTTSQAEEGYFGECPNDGTCELGYSGCVYGTTFDEFVPGGLTCNFTGFIQQSAGILQDPAIFTIDGEGSGCDLTIEYDGCDEYQFDVTCEEGSVTFAANDSANFNYDVTCQDACVENAGESCFEGEGICARTGVVQCDGSCSAIEGAPYSGGEICTNGLDDNCNGEVDELECDVPRCVPVNFNSEELREGLPIARQLELQGIIGVAAENNDGPNEAILFNSMHPTGNDLDLGTPNELYSGPGIGAGGASNSESLGHLLIIAENVDDGDGDGLVDDPNDEASGGTIYFTLAEPRIIERVKLVDIDDEETGGYVRGFAGVDPSFEHAIPTAGDNSAQTLEIDPADQFVNTFSVELASSGAVASFELCCVENVGESCSAGEGICAGEGIVQCDGSCDATPGEPNPGGEICGNELDDDCNGLVDENNAENTGEVCAVGVGACENSGVVLCTGVCDAEPGVPGEVEICDNQIDDDCNGIVDDTDQCPFGVLGINASDGTSFEHVEVVWSTDECVETFELFRSEFGDLGPLLGEFPKNVQTTLDTSAVPGVIYNYTIKGFDSEGIECAGQAMDPGFRLGPDNDCDGDGIPDGQEVIDGTDPCDPGSNKPRLVSPVFTKWNTFLSQVNFLELVAAGTEQISATVTVFDIEGEEIGSQFVVIPAGEQRDIDINALVGRVIDTYGLVRVDFNDATVTPGAILIGRLTHYRPDPDASGIPSFDEEGTFSFVFARELSNPSTGVQYATGNSYDPQAQGFVVPNWVEIINPEDFPQSYTYNLYNQKGVIIESFEVQVPRRGERDLNGGHEFGEGVYLAEVIPANGAALSIIGLARYSSNSFGGNEALTYNFAFVNQGRVGTGDMQYAPITNEVGGCFNTQNWVEVVNTREIDVTADIVFKDASGQVVGTDSMLLESRCQFHYNATALLEKGMGGSVEVTADEPGSVVAQSLVYYTDCESGFTQTAYSSPARIAANVTEQVGSFNVFLGIDSIQRFIALRPTVSQLTYRASNGLIAQDSFELQADVGAEISVTDSGIFGPVEDILGTVTVRTDVPRAIIGDSYRDRSNPGNPGKKDFVMWTPFN